MKKTLSLLVALFCISSIVNAQPPKFEDLILLYADGKYDKCIAKAEKYTNSDKHGKKPIPYLYMSKSFFAISQESEKWVKKNEAFKKAFKEALSYAAKFRKKDKEGAYNNEEDVKDYMSELKAAITENTENFMEESNYKKAVSELKKASTFSPDDAGVWLLKGVCNYYMKAKSPAKMDFEEANKILETLTFSELYDSEKAMLKLGLMEYARLFKAKSPDKASAMLDKGYKWFEEDKDYKALYDEIVN